MNTPTILTLLLVMTVSAAGQEARSGQNSGGVSTTPSGATDAASENCIVSVKGIPFKRQPLPSDIKRHVPSGAFVRLVLPLSSTDTLTIYKVGERRADGFEEADPNTRLLITRQGQPVFQFSVENLRMPGESYDRKWGMSAVAMKAAHLCSDDNDITYLVLQTGNQGGFFVALKRDAGNYRLVPIKPVQQGRLELDMSNPTRITVWSVAREDAADCTACPKHYVVETMQFEGKSFKVVAKRKTKGTFTSFQDEPLKVSR